MPGSPGSLIPRPCNDVTFLNSPRHSRVRFRNLPALSVYNTLSRRKEPLEPLRPGEVRLYVCGPTVYSWVHIGNARTFTIFDVVVRYLRHRGYRVSYVRNYTDVDDKIINAAREAGRTRPRWPSGTSGPSRRMPPGWA